MDDRMLDVGCDRRKKNVCVFAVQFLESYTNMEFNEKKIGWGLTCALRIDWIVKLPLYEGQSFAGFDEQLGTLQIIYMRVVYATANEINVNGYHDA